MADQDDPIVRQIQQRLQTNPQLDARDVQVRAENGMITLAGSVRTGREKQLAGEAAGEVQGVISVENHLHITGPGEPSDQGVQAKVGRGS